MPSGQQYLTALAQFAPLVVLIVLFYLLLIRPQRKRDKAEREMRNSIEVGDEISTIGGFIGRVVNIKDDVLIIETSNDRTKLKIYRWAIRGKEAPATESVEAPKEADKNAK
ncbi:preprotein translocase subunit YajC [Agathobaculum sp. Marseille-P7918]|uniref:preprotein translocase subunit YajC n=1 Tax=Agathobaculum sp. Marseille-P7918 TaxID=2479843 RepID=UPI000F63EECC|nr:preprotein translocase subunit YajC [Agathobaculum sp. Marseille-P7918]